MTDGRSIPWAACLAALAFLACLPGCWLMMGVDKKDLDQDSYPVDGTDSDILPDGPDSDQIQDPSDDQGEIEAVSCTTSADCSDLEPCNGQETCSAEGFCVSGAPLPDNTTCVTQSGRTGVCRLFMCIPEGCGDSELDYGEECDDGNMISRDGCEPNCTFSCHEDEECLQSDPCVDASCVENDSGKICEETYTHQPCDDWNACTVTDTCDGAGHCIGTGDPCDDDLDCTEQECIATDGSFDCYYDTRVGFCVIESTCFENGQENQLNQCQICDPDDSDESWTPVPDFVSVCGTLGRCCQGECIEDAECCSNADCGPGCTGSATPCSSFVYDAECMDQAGCMMRIGRCYKLALPLCPEIVTESECNSNCGCEWNDLAEPPSCSPIDVNCPSYSETQCDNDCMCDWDDGGCSGTATACSSFMNEAACLAQDGCDWVLYLSCSNHDCR